MSQTITVLQVDDDEDILAIAELALTLVDWCDLHQVASGQQALEVIENVKPDLLLLDAMMPGLSGEETWARIKEKPGFSHIPTIFMTAKAEGSYGKELEKKGALGVITKPFDPISLGDNILDLIQKRKNLENAGFH